MFAPDAAPKSFLCRPPRHGGWGRVLLLAGALLGASIQLAYGSGPRRTDLVVVGAGETVWSIAAERTSADPRPRVDEILRLNHLSSPMLVPGQTLLVPVG